MITIRKLRLDGLLSFAPGSETFELRDLNVLIGPNGSGKSNLIEALELLSATPQDFAATVRDGGGPAEWLWKGGDAVRPAEIEVVLENDTPTDRSLRYRLRFTAVQSRLEVLDEAIEEAEQDPHKPYATDVFFYYRFQHGHPVLNVLDHTGNRIQRRLQREDLLPDQSVLAQRKDPERYPEVTWTGRRFGAIHTFREWTFGRYVPLRQPQPADLPEDRLLPDGRNLALVLNQIEHAGETRLNQLLKQFFSRFDRMSTRISGGTVQSTCTNPASERQSRPPGCPTVRFDSSRSWRRCCLRCRHPWCALRNPNLGCIRTRSRCSPICSSMRPKERNSWSPRIPMPWFLR